MGNQFWGESNLSSAGGLPARFQVGFKNLRSNKMVAAGAVACAPRLDDVHLGTPSEPLIEDRVVICREAASRKNHKSFSRAFLNILILQKMCFSRRGLAEDVGGDVIRGEAPAG